MVSLFYSYSHKDEYFRNKLEVHLSILKNDRLIRQWHDRKITPGQEIHREIDSHMIEADVILLLVSPDFLASPECQNETERALSLKQEKLVSVVPIIVKPCSWQDHSGISALLALPEDGKPISQWNDRDAAFLNTYKGIKKTIEKISFSLRETVKNTLTEIEFISQNNETTRLDDIFVFPTIIHEKERIAILQGKEDARIRIRNFEDIWTLGKFIILRGDDKSGKTVVCRKLFLDNCNHRNAAILLSGTDITSPLHHDDLITKKFQEQFRGSYRFWKRQENKTLIIDDFTNASRLQFIDFAIENFTRIFITIPEDEHISFFRDEKRFANFEVLSINSLSHVQQEELIRKWKTLGSPSRNATSITHGVIDQIEDRLNSIIHHSRIVPRYPFYILSILQTYEAFMPQGLQITAYGHCYQSLITANLIGSEIHGDDIDSSFNFLGHLSNEMLRNNSDSCSQREFDDFLNKYEAQYIVKTTTVARLTKDTKSILRKTNDCYSFRYAFAYYFFLGYYLARNSANCKRLIEDLIEKSYIKKNAFVLIFMTHHTQDEELVENLSSRTMAALNETSPATLDTEETRLLEKALQSLPEQLLSNKPVETERRLQREYRDKNEDNKDKAEDFDSEEAMVDVYRSLKNMEILGQILRNKYGSLPREKIGEIVNVICNAGLRLVSICINRESIQALEDYCINRVGEEAKRSNDNPQKLDLLIRKSIRALAFMAIFRLLRRIGISIRKPELREVVHVSLGHNTTARKLLGFFFLLDTAKKLTKKDVDHFIDLIDELKRNKNTVAERLLSLVIQIYANTHDIEFALRQRIFQNLDIRYKANLLIKSSSRK